MESVSFSLGAPRTTSAHTSIDRDRRISKEMKEHEEKKKKVLPVRSDAQLEKVDDWTRKKRKTGFVLMRKGSSKQFGRRTRSSFILKMPRKRAQTKTESSESEISRRNGQKEGTRGVQGADLGDTWVTPGNERTHTGEVRGDRKGRGIRGFPTQRLE